MFKLLNRKEIDENKWEKCVNHNSQLPNLYANTWFLDAVSPHWKAAVWGDYETVFPLPIKFKWRFLPYLAQPLFTQQLGFWGNQLNEIELIDFRKYLKFNFLIVDIQLNEHNSWVTFKSNIRRNICLNIKENFANEYSTNLSRNIKKAIKNQLLIEQYFDFNFIIDFFINEKDAEFNLNTELKQTYISLINNLKKIDIVTGLVCKLPNNEIVAVGIFVKWGNRIVFLMGTSNKAGRENGAMHFLIDSAIRNLANIGDVFDFEGSMNDNLAKFYLSFGAKECPYYVYKHSFFNFH